MMRLEADLLMDVRQSIVMVDCLVNIDHQRLEVGWAAFRTGDHPPSVLLLGDNLEVEIELPISRRHFPVDVMQSDPDEPIFFPLTPQYLKQFRGNREL